MTYVQAAVVVKVPLVQDHFFNVDVISTKGYYVGHSRIKGGKATLTFYIVKQIKNLNLLYEIRRVVDINVARKHELVSLMMYYSADTHPRKSIFIIILLQEQHRFYEK